MRLADPAKHASAFYPCVLRPFVPNISRIGVESFGDGVGAIGVLRTIQAAPRQEAGEMGDGYAKYLLG